MKKQQINLVLIIGMLLASMSLYADYKVATVSSGTVDAVNTGKSSVTINGQQYRYQLDEKGSMFSLDEVQHVPVKINQLKVGNTYHFEKTSNKEDPQPADFDSILFISATPLSEIE